MRKLYIRARRCAHSSLQLMKRAVQYVADMMKNRRGGSSRMYWERTSVPVSGVCVCVCVCTRVCVCVLTYMYITTPFHCKKSNK